MKEQPNQPNENAYPRYHNASFMLGIVGSHLFTHEAAADKADPDELDYVYGKLIDTVGYLSGIPSGEAQLPGVEAMLRDPQRVGSDLERKLLQYSGLEPGEPVPPGRGYTRDAYREDLDDLEERMQDLVEQGKDQADNSEYDCASACFKDLSDLQDIYDALQDGSYDLANSYIKQLDTAIREEIPQRLYDHLHLDE